MFETLFASSGSSQFFTGFQLKDLWYLAEAAGHTLLISAIAISGGTVLGVFFGWVLSVSRWAGAASLGLVLDMFRSVPLIIQLILFFNFFPILGLPLNPFAAGTIVLVFYTSALVASVARGGIESVPATTRKAARSLGMSYWQDLRYITFPIGCRSALPAWTGVALGVLEGFRAGFRSGLCGIAACLPNPDHPDPGALYHPGDRRCLLFRTVLPDRPSY